MKFIYGITTYNRLDYLRKHVKTWFKTIDNKKHDWVLIIADDGSNDGTIDYLEELKEICTNKKYITFLCTIKEGVYTIK